MTEIIIKLIATFFTFSVISLGIWEMLPIWPSTKKEIMLNKLLKTTTFIFTAITGVLTMVLVWIMELKIS